jgi:hypothetical protein
METIVMGGGVKEGMKTGQRLYGGRLDSRHRRLDFARSNDTSMGKDMHH